METSIGVAEVARDNQNLIFVTTDPNGANLNKSSSGILPLSIVKKAAGSTLLRSIRSLKLAPFTTDPKI